MTAYKDEVKELYNIDPEPYRKPYLNGIDLDSGWPSMAKEAYYQEYRYVTHVDKGVDVYYELDASILDGDGGYKKLHHGYSKLPKRNHKESKMNIVDRTIEFLQMPERSYPNKFYAELAKYEFFNPLNTERARVQILETILHSTKVCPEGEKKFREHMGDLLKPAEYVVGTVEIYSPQPGGKLDLIVNDLNQLIEDGPITRLARLRIKE